MKTALTSRYDGMAHCVALQLLHGYACFRWWSKIKSLVSAYTQYARLGPSMTAMGADGDAVDGGGESESCWLELAKG
jgi:hypothetical protein